MEQFGNQYVVKASKAVIALLFVLGLGFLLVGVLLVIECGILEDKLLFSLLVGLPLAGLGLRSLWEVYRISKVCLMIDEEGIYESSFGQKIPWNDITSCCFELGDGGSGASFYMLVIQTHNDRLFIKDLIRYFPRAFTLLIFINFFDSRELTAAIRHFSHREDIIVQTMKEPSRWVKVLVVFGLALLLLLAFILRQIKW